MTSSLQGAVRAMGVLLAAFLVLFVVGWQWEPRDFVTAARVTPVIAMLPACWARMDQAKLGPIATQWLWARAAAWLSGGVAVVAVLRGWPMIGIVFLAVVSAAVVAVPAWTVVATAGGSEVSGDSAERGVSRAVMSVVAIAGATALLVLPIAVFAWQATIEWSGCFLTCRQSDHAAAAAWAAGAGGLVIDVMAWGVAGWRGFPRALTIAATVPLVAIAGLALLLP